MLMMHENAFTLACERRTVGQTSTMMKLAEEDFALFMEMLKCDLAAIGKSTGTDILSLMANYHMPFAQDSDGGPGKQIRILCDKLVRAKDVREFSRIISRYYAEYGVGIYGLYKAFRVAEGEDRTRIVPVREVEDVKFSDLVGYEEQKKALEERVIHEARSISKYISVPKTTPFAIMYLASEGLYAEIASSPNAIPERLQSDFNIMVAGPSTITALLNSLSMGFKIAAINEKANEVRKILSAVKAQYDTFSTVLAKAKKKIDEAGKSLDDAQHRNEIIQKKLKSIEEVDVSSSNEVLGIEESADLDE
jgi:uncharacterized membrane protein YfbV (UPF0208 family)